MENSEDEEDLIYNDDQQLLFIISKACENRTTNGKFSESQDNGPVI